MSHGHCIALALLGVVAPSASFLLREAAMIYAHDAATGYLGYIPEVTAWAQTQKGNWKEQIACGVRAFDVRMKEDKGKLIMHHASITIKTEFVDALDDAIEGANTVPGEVIVMSLSHFDGSDVGSLSAKALASRNVTLLSCSEAGSMTYADAVAKGKTVGGGSVVAVENCITENWDPSITCYGPYDGTQTTQVTPAFLRANPPPKPPAIDSVFKCGCYDEDDSQKSAFAKLETYINKTVASPSSGLWITQVMWQESTETVVKGNLCFSSLLDDCERSHIHDWTLQRIGSWPNLNFLGTNNVCLSDGSGKKLAAACKARNDRLAAQ